MAFGWYKTVTIDHTQCGSTDSTDFPVVIWVTDADLKTVGNGGKVTSASGFDIRPYADSGAMTALSFELVPNVYDPTTGALEMWVKLPTVSHTSDTVFYLFFGDSGLTTDGTNLAATWANNFNNVYHLANGTTLDLTDSSGNAYTLTDTGSTPAGAGTVDGGAATNSGQHLDTASFSPVGDRTWSVWGKTSQSGSFQMLLSSKPTLETEIRLNTSNHANFIAGGGTAQVTGSVDLADGNWHYYVGLLDNTNGLDFYVDGASIGTAGVGVFQSTSHYRLGDREDNAIFPFVGVLDEQRMDTVLRSPSWILQSYNNQKPSSTFLSYGALTPVGGGGGGKPTLYYDAQRRQRQPKASNRWQRSSSGRIFVPEYFGKAA